MLDDAREELKEAQEKLQKAREKKEKAEKAYAKAEKLMGGSPNESKKNIKTMKHLHTFESFIGSMNEATNHGDITSAMSGGDDRAFTQFYDKAKPGDTFMYAPNGVELDYVDEKDVNKKELEVQVSTTSRGAKPVKCTVLKSGTSAMLSGGSMDFDGEEDVILFSMDGEKGKAFVLTRMFG
jgi:hypothetical protein